MERYLRIGEGHPPSWTRCSTTCSSMSPVFPRPHTFQTLKQDFSPAAEGADGRRAVTVLGVRLRVGRRGYSLAIALVEFFEKAGERREAQIFATDISELSIERRGRHLSGEILQDVSPERLRWFFNKPTGNYQSRNHPRHVYFCAAERAVDPPSRTSTW